MSYNAIPSVGPSAYSLPPMGLPAVQPSLDPATPSFIDTTDSFSASAPTAAPTAPSLTPEASFGDSSLSGMPPGDPSLSGMTPGDPGLSGLPSEMPAGIPGMNGAAEPFPQDAALQPFDPALAAPAAYPSAPVAPQSSSSGLLGFLAGAAGGAFAAAKLVLPKLGTELPKLGRFGILGGAALAGGWLVSKLFGSKA